MAINANVVNRSAGEVSDDIRAQLDTIGFPPGYRYQFSGSTKNMAESFGYAVSALAMAVIFIYMILASQFKSFLQPLALMTSLPLTLIGVVLALLLFRSTLSMFSIIGIVMLMGLVTKNAILLVDFAIRMREQGMERTEALLHAAKVRLRPILMTTLAMIFGMVPLAFALTEGSEQRAPDGPGRHRRRDHLVAADAGGGAGGLLLPGRPGRTGCGAGSRRARKRARTTCGGGAGTSRCRPLKSTDLS